MLRAACHRAALCADPLARNDVLIEHDFTVPRRDRTRVAGASSPSDMRGRRECRVLAATHGPPAERKAGGSYHRFSQIIRHSLHDGFNTYITLSLGTGLSCSHHARDHHLARLTPASGCQDHTILCPPHRRSSARKLARVAKASIASRLTFGDDWPQRPSCRGGTGASYF